MLLFALLLLAMLTSIQLTLNKILYELKQMNDRDRGMKERNRDV